MAERMAEASRAIENVDFGTWAVAPWIGLTATTALALGVLGLVLFVPALLYSRGDDAWFPSPMRKRLPWIAAGMTVVGLTAGMSLSEVLSDRIAERKASFEDEGHCQVAFGELWLGKTVEIPDGFRERMAYACGDLRTNVALAGR